ncbi:hypothetical protein IM660_15695 [Ruania alkalisoli]|uniref:DUF4245 domain-containing protein n=1 Tax=Ruania alkalisoli TaxID=2779775 RepID=A0A7M1SR52_9MICO|nr:hypothetical protein [Ruania alkalisoli]QOR70058.1 hypothetical protein IM660_15695 [Ruania alkalisoli]
MTSQTDAGGPGHGPGSDGLGRGESKGRRPRWLLPTLIALVVGLLIVLVVLLVPRLGDEAEPGASPSSTASEHATTAAPDPIERETSTPLLAALPDTVEATAPYAVTAQDADPEPLDPNALESWHLTYTGPSDAVTLRIAQWKEAGEADETLSTLTEGTDPVETGEVDVDGEVAGRYVVWETDDGARVAWTNATVMLLAEGPDVETVTTFYRAYPL